LAACDPASTAPVVKIGLVAPFEGRYRAIGYEAIYAARLAVREINSAGGIGGYRVEMIALDDSGDPAMAIEQARKLAIDPQVIAVVGHYYPETTSAALDAYCAEALPLLAVESARPAACGSIFLLTPPVSPDFASDDPAAFLFAASVPHPADIAAAAAFAEAYTAIPIDGTRPGPIALQTYDAMYLLFDALARAESSSREGMARALAGSDFTGLGGAYRFDAAGNRIAARVYVYRYGKDGEPEPVR
jgi:ABC-type branched-subunit amino acid transport system substrate-binding protein